MFTELERKLIWLMLDQAAQPGEIQNSALALAQSLRRRGLRPETLIRGSRPESAPGVDTTLAMARRRVMPFGRHRGRRLEAIEPGYLRWALRECSNLSLGLREAILLVIAAGGAS